MKYAGEELVLSDPEQLRMPKVSAPLDINVSCVKRIIAIGDIHGCFDELYELMNRLAPQSDDLVVFLGDLGDRGPKSSAVYAYVRYLCENRPDTFLVPGNHCEKLVRHRRHEVARRLNPAYKNPMKVEEERAAEYELVSDAEVLWLSKQPAVIYSVGKNPRIFTHAGLIAPPPGKAWERSLMQPMSGLIRNRYLRRRRPHGACGQQVVDLGWEPAPCVRGPRGEMLQPPGSINWDEIWTGPRVIYGHAVHDLAAPRVNNDCYGVDTGCCFGGRLTAYQEDLRTGEVTFVQVDAQQTYCSRAGDDES